MLAVDIDGSKTVTFGPKSGVVMPPPEVGSVHCWLAEPAQSQIWDCAGSANQQWTLPTSGGGITTPDFGPNVTVFDPSMSTASIQAKIDSVYSTQQNNEVGTQRNALLFA